MPKAPQAKNFFKNAHFLEILNEILPLFYRRKYFMVGRSQKEAGVITPKTPKVVAALCRKSKLTGSYQSFNIISLKLPKAIIA